MYDDSIVTYFAETDSRNKRIKFGIKAKDRTKHVYVIGKTGMGKSTVLENMAVQDIQNGEGMAFIDPHGKTADLLLDYIPEHRKKDVVYFAPFDLDYPISFNVLEQVDADKRHLVVSGLMSTFKKIWQDAWSARMEYILTNTLLALLEYPNATLLGVNRMYSDKEFRKDVIAHITDPTVKAFWTEEFAKYTEKFAAEATPAIQNKIGQFTSNALIRNMIGQPKSSFDLRKILDEKKIMIINLSKGRVGEQNANLLGGMLITKIYLAAMSRADASPALMRTLPQFYLYVDEFQSFANESFADILSEARKYKLNLTMAHQYIEQMEEEVRAAVFGNVGTMIVFRVGAYDAEVLEKEFMPTFTAEDIVNLGVYQIYLKLMIDGVSSQPFSATTLPPIALPPVSPADDVKAMSRQQFAHNRADVEKAIADALAPIKVALPTLKSIPASRPDPAGSPASKPPMAQAAPFQKPQSQSQPQNQPAYSQKPPAQQAAQSPKQAPPAVPPAASVASAAATPKSIPLSYFVKPGQENQAASSLQGFDERGKAPAPAQSPTAGKDRGTDLNKAVSSAVPSSSPSSPPPSEAAPRPQAAPPLQPDAKAKTGTAEVKPFAEAFKTMEKDSIPARARQIEGSFDEIPSIKLVRDANAQKSVPLSSLSPIISKTPTPARVSELKAALAKAMAKPPEAPKPAEPSKTSESEKPVQTPPPIKTDDRNAIPVPSPARSDASRTPVPTPQPPRSSEPEKPVQPEKSEAPVPKPPLRLPQETKLPSPPLEISDIPEVPEDVLKNALKVE